jgi:serine/threonine protein kinase
MSPETEIQHLLIDDQDPNPNIMQKFYQPIMVLGEGSFSTVIKAYDNLSGYIVAIKIIDKSTLRNY